MKLVEFKNYFIKELSDLYPSEESNSFFQLFAEKYLNLSRIEIAVQGEQTLSEANIEIFILGLDRLKNYEPVQYILGDTEFYGLQLSVNEHTLIPRPETEELVQWIIEDIKNKNLNQATLLDVGTGSGCIAISLAKNLPNSEIDALDISEGALKIAIQNAHRHRVDINFFQQDVLTETTLDKKYDIIVSNPPYVRESEKKLMAPNVTNHEPATALFVDDDDPLIFYRKIISIAETFLKAGGLLYFEINEYLSKDLEELINLKRFIDIETRKDIFGKDRMIKCVKYE